jgi:hypothetical protein
MGAVLLCTVQIPHSAVCGGGGQVLVMARQCDAQEEPRHPESPLHALPAELFDYLVRLLAAEPECWLVEEPRIG